MKAAEMLIAEGKADAADFPVGTDGFKPPQSEFIDKITFDGKKPNAYLSKFPIGLKSGEVVQDSGEIKKN